MSKPLVVETIDLHRTYHIDGNEVPALRGVNLAVSAGEFVVIKGRSGSGKTTLLNIIGTLDRPDSGAVFVNGQDVAHMSEQETVELRRHQIGFVFQSFGLLPNFSAYETVEFALRLAGLSSSERHARAVESLALVGLEDRLHHRPDEMSGGQQQRLCIARAIAIRPSVILADEPTGELDSHTGRGILALFRKLVLQENVALIVTTHDPAVLTYAHTVYELDDGQLTRLDATASQAKPAVQ